jgi:hypothetical protein
MKKDDDFNMLRDVFGYHDEDFDGDVDWEDADIEDQFFDELNEHFYPRHSAFDDDEEDDDDDDLFDDDEDEWDDFDEDDI